MGECTEASMQPVLLCKQPHRPLSHSQKVCKCITWQCSFQGATSCACAGTPCRKALCKWACRFGREWGAHALPGLLLVALPCSRWWLHYSHQRPFTTLAPPPSLRRLIQSLPDLPHLSRRSSYSSSCSSISCSSSSCHTSCINSHSSSHQCVSQRLMPCRLLLNFTIHKLSCSPLDMWQATTVPHPQVHSHSLGCTWIPNNSSSLCKKHRLGL